MDWLIDTSILVRTIHAGNPHRTLTVDAVASLRRRGDRLFVVPQNIIEFWAVATRPAEANGLGLSVEDAQTELLRINLLFILKPEDETIFRNWEKLAATYKVSGKTSHDARIVAAMQTHGIENLLTFNTPDFKRYSDIINVSSPHDIR